MEILIIAVYLLLSTGGLVLIKTGAETVKLGIKEGIFNCQISLLSILGLIFYIGSFLIFTFVLVKKFDLTYIMPIVTGISQILVILAGLFVFKEHIGNFGIARNNINSNRSYNAKYKIKGRKYNNEKIICDFAML